MVFKLESTPACTLSRPAGACDASQTQGGGFGRRNGFLALDAALHRTSLEKRGTCEVEGARLTEPPVGRHPVLPPTSGPLPQGP